MEKQIKLHGKYGEGKFATVDSEYFDLLNSFRWHVLKIGYPVYKEKGGRKEYKKYVYMHSFIMNTPKGMVTDHINMNKLDNRKENLRICTKTENNRNLGIRKNNSSGFKGVSWSKKSNKWTAYITKDYKTKNLGLFLTKKEAALVYNTSAKNLFGNFARLNVV